MSSTTRKIEVLPLFAKSIKNFKMVRRALIQVWRPSEHGAPPSMRLFWVRVLCRLHMMLALIQLSFSACIHIPSSLNPLIRLSAYNHSLGWSSAQLKLVTSVSSSSSPSCTPSCHSQKLVILCYYLIAQNLSSWLPTQHDIPHRPDSPKKIPT